MFYVCYSHDYFLFKISNPHLNIESSHWILELETTTQHRSWCLRTRIVNYKCALSDGKLPEALPGFLSSANPSFLGQPQDSQRWTYPSLQNLQTAEKLSIGGGFYKEEFTVLAASLGGPPSQAELRPMLNFHGWTWNTGYCGGTSVRSPDKQPRQW